MSFDARVAGIRAEAARRQRERAERAAAEEARVAAETAVHCEAARKLVPELDAAVTELRGARADSLARGGANGVSFMFVDRNGSRVTDPAKPGNRIWRPERTFATWRADRAHQRAWSRRRFNGWHVASTSVRSAGGPGRLGNYRLTAELDIPLVGPLRVRRDQRKAAIGVLTLEEYIGAGRWSGLNPTFSDGPTEDTTGFVETADGSLEHWIDSIARYLASFDP